MKVLPPDRTVAVKELEKRLLKKWNDQKPIDPSQEEKTAVKPVPKKKK